MKTYIYYYELNGLTYSVNLEAKDMEEAVLIALSTGYELQGELIETIILNN